jgi:hypothetical protein
LPLNRVGRPECIERQLSSLPQQMGSQRYDEIAPQGDDPIRVPRLGS